MCLCSMGLEVCHMERWVIAKLSEILEIDAGRISPSTRFDEDIECDSIDLVELINAAEAEFGVTVDEEVLYDVATVAELASVIERRRQ